MVFITKSFAIQSEVECCDINAKHIEFLDSEVDGLMQDSLTKDMIGSSTIGISDGGMLEVTPASIGSTQLEPSIVEALKQVVDKLQELSAQVESLNTRIDSSENDVRELKDEVTQLTQTVNSTSASVTSLSTALGSTQEDVAELALQIQ